MSYPQCMFYQDIYFIRLLCATIKADAVDGVLVSACSGLNHYAHQSLACISIGNVEEFNLLGD